MTARINKRLRVTGYVVVGLALAGFALRVLFKVVSGDSLETYRSATLVQWTYGGALIVLAILAIFGLIGLAAKWYERWRG